MRRDPSIPPLYASGANWELRPKDPSDTRWRYANEVATEGWGDCQALAGYRAAELRVKGGDPAAHVRVYPTGENKFHAVVARGNGWVEDPSVVLGMMPFPGAPMTTNELPAIQGPAGGSPGGGSPGLSPDAIMGAKRRIAHAVVGLHPYCMVTGSGCLGDETGREAKIARIRDAAPEFQQPTFHIVGHRKGGKAGWKGVHRVPMKDGTAIVGMTRTYVHPADCVGDAAGLISDVAKGILKVPGAIFALSPFGAATTVALADPAVQHALGSVARTVKNEVTKKPPTQSNGGGGGGDGWGDWGTSVTGGPRAINEDDAAVVGWGLSNLTHILTAPARAAADIINPHHPRHPRHAKAKHPATVGWGLSNLASMITTPVKAVGNLISHPSLSNLGRVAISPMAGIVNTLPGTSGLVNRAMGFGGGSPAAPAPAAGQVPGMPPGWGTSGRSLATYQSQQAPGMPGSGFGMPPGWPPGMPPGQTWYPPGVNPATGFPPGVNPASVSQYNPYATPLYSSSYNAPTAADYGLPTGGMPGGSGGGPGEAADLATAFSDPYNQSAISSYTDPAGYYSSQFS